MKDLLSSSSPLSRRLYWTAAVSICLFAVVLRLPGLSGRSFWIDEAYSYFFAMRPLSVLWTQVPLYETHPPMYYTFLHGWLHLFGTSEFALRSMSVLASLGTVVLIIFGAKWLSVGPNGERVALVAALLLSVNKGSIQYAQQARPYAFETLSSELAVVCGLVILQYFYNRRSQTQPVTLPYPALLGLIVGAAFTLWFHNTAVLIVASIWVAFVAAILTCYQQNKVRLVVVVTVALGIAGLLWTPFIPFLLIQSKNVATSFWITFSWIEFLSAWVLAAGGKLPLLLVFLLSIAGFVVIWRKARHAAIFLGVVLLLPYLMTIVISYTIRPIYIQRLFEWMCPEVMLLAATGIVVALKNLAIRKIALFLVLALSLMQSVLFFRGPSEDWRSTIDYIAVNAQPGDLLVLSPNEVQPAVEYYARNRKSFPDVMEVPAPFPALGLKGRTYRANLGAPSISESDRPALREAIRTHKRIWLIERGQEDYDPKGIVKNEIEQQRKIAPISIPNVVPFSLYE